MKQQGYDVFASDISPEVISFCKKKVPEYADKYYIGYFEGEKLVAVMDLILNFPNKETAFIGFFYDEYSLSR